MYTLIGSPKSRAFRVLWMLEELELPYELQAVGPHSEEIKSANPSGKIPALIVDGEAIVDSVAIMQFLADRHSKLTHTAGTLERAKQDSFTQFICDDIDANCWIMAKHSFVYPEQLRNKAAVKLGVSWDINRAKSALEKRIGEGPWLTGKTFTIADLMLTHCSDWMRSAGVGELGDKATALVNNAMERPAYIRAAEIRDAQ